MTEENNTLKLSLCQMSSTPNFNENLLKARSLLESNQNEGVDLFVFPENCLFRTSYDEIRRLKKPESYFDNELGKISEQYRATILWGGVPVQYGEQVYNQLMVYNENGNLISRYQKIHLFQFNGFGKELDESSVYCQGKKPETFQLKDWKIGLAICYDLRFPELFRYYADSDVIICPADFTYYTGNMHWEVLLRARAIENQCYVAGANQCGMNEKLKVKSYGQSMIIDPWGKGVACLQDEEKGLNYEMDRKSILGVRHQIPALKSIMQSPKW